MEQWVRERRAEFPILSERIYGKPLVYLDNAATTQLPRPVLEAITEHYTHQNGNVHRGIHFLSEQSTRGLEEAREKVARFLGSPSSEQIVFTSGATEAINLVADSYLAPRLHPGDEVLVSQLEHHANLVPWQQLCQARGAILRMAPAPQGELDMGAFRQLLGTRTRMVAITQVSNVTGTVTPLDEIITAAHEREIPVLVDAAQGVRHFPIHVERLNCDFLCFSGHKLLAPTGIGALYCRADRLEELRPVRFGGGMVERVTWEKTTFASAPHCLEAGTPNYSGAIALGAAINYLDEIGLPVVYERERLLLDAARRHLAGTDHVRILGRPAHRAGAISFVVDGVHPYDLAAFLDKDGIALRSGSLCAGPLLDAFDVTAAARVSPAFYNTEEELDFFAERLAQVIPRLRRAAGL